jgi:hypothetical protein
MGKETNGQEINIHELIANARKQINDEPNMSAGLKATLELVLGVCLLLAGKCAVKNSKNSNLPPGEWKIAGYERRQVFNLVIKRQVTEYRAERLENEHGEYITAEFPEGLVQAAQYGNDVKAHGVYMSVEQLVPCERVSEHFDSQLNLPVSAGSICNFKKEAYERLETFEEWLKPVLPHPGCCIAKIRG